MDWETPLQAPRIHTFRKSLLLHHRKKVVLDERAEVLFFCFFAKWQSMHCFWDILWQHCLFQDFPFRTESTVALEDSHLKDHAGGFVFFNPLLTIFQNMLDF